MTTLASTTRQLARARLYALLGRLLRLGLRPGDLEAVGQVDVLARAVRLPFDLDREGAAHYRLFGHEVFPYESAFRESSGSVGGATTVAVAARYRRAGAELDCTSESPDHIGHELAYLGHLSRQAAREPASDGVAGGDWRRVEAGDFLAEHVLAWLPSLAVAVRLQADPFWVAVVELALSLALTDCDELRSGRVVCSGGDAGSQTMATSGLLDDPATTIRDIARHLLRPANSGVLLTRGDLLGIGRGLRLPCGFGGRQAMLTALFRGAIEYDRLADLLAALDGRVVEWDTVVAEYGVLWPPASRQLAPLRARLAATRRLLSGLGDRARNETARAQ